MIDSAENIDPDERPNQRFERLVELPPSAKLVFYALEKEGPFTQADLTDSTLLPPRTIRIALNTLEAADLVRKDIYVRDARKKLFRAKRIMRNSTDETK